MYIDGKEEEEEESRRRKGKTSKMLLWLRNGSFYWKNDAVTNVLGGYPSRTLVTAPLFQLLHIFLVVFNDF